MIGRCKVNVKSQKRVKVLEGLSQTRKGIIDSAEAMTIDQERTHKEMTLLLLLEELCQLLAEWVHPRRTSEATSDTSREIPRGLNRERHCWNVIERSLEGEGESGMQSSGA